MCSGGGGGTTTTVQQSDPWIGVRPYLTGSQTTRLKPGVQQTYSTHQVWNPNGGNSSDTGPMGAWETQNVISNPASDYETVGAPGIYPEAQRLYQQQGWSPQMQSLTDAQSQALAGRAPGQVDTLGRFGTGLFNGEHDANVQRVGNIAGANSIWSPSLIASTVSDPAQINQQGYSAATANSNGYDAALANAFGYDAAHVDGADKIASQAIDPAKAFSSLGSANPTGSISRLLSGNVGNPYLLGMQQSGIDTAMRGYNDAVQTAMQQIAPNIRSEAVASGQYGGSRQGIAEGLMGQQLARNARDLGIASMDAGTNLLGNAYQQAQQNMYGTANNMASLGLSNAQSNAGRDLQAQTSNASNQLAAQQFNAASDNTSRQFFANAQNNASQTNAGAVNAARQFGANAGNVANLANAAASNTANQFNTQLGYNQQAQNIANLLNAGQFNASARNNMGQFNADNSLKAQGLNAANSLNTQQFNANLGLQNNAQAMTQAQQNISNRLQGVNMGMLANQLNDQAYQQQMGMLQSPNEYNWNNLNNYSSLVTNGARLGGTSSSQQPYFSNPMGNALGLGMGGLGLYNGLTSAGLLGGGAAAAAGTGAAAAGAGDLLSTMMLLA